MEWDGSGWLVTDYRILSWALLLSFLICKMGIISVVLRSCNKEGPFVFYDKFITKGILPISINYT